MISQVGDAYRYGQVALPGVAPIVIGDGSGAGAARVRIRDAQTARRLPFRPDLALGEAYMDGHSMASAGTASG